MNGVKRNTEQFIVEAKLVHGDKYDYSKVDYKNWREKVCIICPIHGEFWQIPNSHLSGHGCPICGDSMLERDVAEILTSNGILYERQKTFDWLGKKSLDFYIPEYNIAIECQGEQHYKPVEHFGGEETFNGIIERDVCKNKLCKEHNVLLLYYSEKRTSFLNELTVNKNNLINIIENGNKN